MSQTVYVQGIKPPDETWRRMKAIWDACEAAGVRTPPEIDRYFEGANPDPLGVIVDINHYKGIVAREWSDDARNGIEVMIDKLPPGTSIIRFVISY